MAALHRTTFVPADPGLEPSRVGLPYIPTRVPHHVYTAMGDAGSPEALAWVRGATRGHGVGLVYVDPPWNRAFVGRFQGAAIREATGLRGVVSEAGSTILPGVPDPAPSTVAEAVGRIARTCHAALTMGDPHGPPGYIVVESGLSEGGAILHAFETAGFEFTHPFRARYGGGEGTPQVVMVGRVRPAGQVSAEATVGLDGDTIAMLTGVTAGFPRYGSAEATDGGFRGLAMATGILDVLTRDPAVCAALTARPAIMDPCLGLGITYRATQALGWQHPGTVDAPTYPRPAFLGIELVPSRYRKTWDMIVTDNREATRKATEHVRRTVAARYHNPEGPCLP